MDLFIFSTAEIVRFAIMLFRVGGIMVFAPFYGSASLPSQIRVVATLVFSAALAPSLPLAQIPQSISLFQSLTLLLGEALIGMSLGLVSLFVFAGMQLAGQIISFQLGFAIIHVIDPQSEVETPVFSFLENYLGLLFFLLINGHHWFITAVSNSLNYFPVNGIHLRGPLVAEVVRLSSQSMVCGLQIAAPIIAVTIIADVVVGIIGRAAPQINILIVGMPLKTLVGFSCLGISFYFLPSYLGNVFMALNRDLLGMLHRLVQG
ncbi:MAG TPA: flagellar biosynthetic protein FliR [Acidobacteriota bacterium]|nr:flagellar biosynthetic protein FliR [Acidobacteriota bacterium]